MTNHETSLVFVMCIRFDVFEKPALIPEFCQGESGSAPAAFWSAPVFRSGTYSPEHEYRRRFDGASGAIRRCAQESRHRFVWRISSGGEVGRGNDSLSIAPGLSNGSFVAFFLIPRRCLVAGSQTNRSGSRVDFAH